MGEIEDGAKSINFKLLSPGQNYARNNRSLYSTFDFTSQGYMYNVSAINPGSSYYSNTPVITTSC